jgi:hypothetical protein
VDRLANPHCAGGPAAEQTLLPHNASTHLSKIHHHR